MGALESYIKSGGADAVGKKVLESVMEKANKATPLAPSKTLNSSHTKKLLPSQKSTLENGVDERYKIYEKKTNWICFKIQRVSQNSHSFHHTKRTRIYKKF